MRYCTKCKKIIKAENEILTLSKGLYPRQYAVQRQRHNRHITLSDI